MPASAAVFSTWAVDCRNYVHCNYASKCGSTHGTASSSKDRPSHPPPTPTHTNRPPPTSRHPDPEAATTTVLIQDKTFPFPAIAPRTCPVLVTWPPAGCLFIIDRTFIHKGRRPGRSPFRAARAEVCRSGDVAAAKLSVEWRCAEPRGGQLASCVIACFERKKTKVG